MGHQFAQIAFTDSVKEVQAALGSRAAYAPMEEGEDYNDILSEREIEFIAARDSFYMASVSETGWPYVQHRGGPVGFIRVLDEKTLGFADFKGNRQYVTVGNVRKDDRVSLFFMDYPNRLRLKLLGRVELIDPDDVDTLAQLEMDDYRAHVERGFVIHVEAFDWNCPQHITPRYTEAEVERLLVPIAEGSRLLKSRTNGSLLSETPELGDGAIAVVVAGVRQLTPRVRAYELRDPDGGQLPAVEAGAHLKVPVTLTNGESAVRHYSISSNPARTEAWEIAVLREDAGSGGSRAVHEQFSPGLGMRIDVPQNNFPMHTDKRPVVLIAGGIGITPIKAMAETLKAGGRPMHLHYAGRSAREMAYLSDLIERFGDNVSTYAGELGHRLDAEHVFSSAPEGAVFYVCGPARLVDGVNDAARALGIGADRVR